MALLPLLLAVAVWGAYGGNTTAGEAEGSQTGSNHIPFAHTTRFILGASAGMSVVAGSVVSVLACSQLSTAVVECLGYGGAVDADIPMLLHPTMVTVSGKVFLGALLTNVGLLAVFATLHIVVWQCMLRRCGTPKHFPGATVAFLVGMNPAVYTSAMGAEGYTGGYLGIVVFVVTFSCSLIMTRRVSLGEKAYFTDPDPPVRIGRKEVWIESPFVLSYGVVFADLRNPKYLMSCVVASAVIGVAFRLPCSHRPYLMGLGHTVTAVATAVHLPFFASEDNAITGVVFLLAATGTFFEEPTFVLAAAMGLAARVAVDALLSIFYIVTNRSRRLHELHRREVAPPSAAPDQPLPIDDSVSTASQQPDTSYTPISLELSLGRDVPPEEISPLDHRPPKRRLPRNTSLVIAPFRSRSFHTPVGLTTPLTTPLTFTSSGPHF